MSVFKDNVIKFVSSVPRGKVVSYGQVALAVGIPRAAIQVGSVLQKLDPHTKVPWWRVVNNSGRLSIKGSVFTPSDQRDLLLAEGVEVKEDFTFNIEEYRFRP